LTRAPKHVLVVDDEPGLRRMLGELFVSEGYVVSEASDGAKGLACMRASCPDVVVIDLMMPVMTGWAFLEEYRRLNGCPDVAIIAISAMFDLQRAATPLRALGVRACLAKPFDIDVLLSLVGTLA
jgi:two-component system nitrogen regulation response regulator NtrX